MDKERYIQPLVDVIKENEEVLDEAISIRGRSHQIVKAIEEFSELNQRLCKYINGHDSDLDYEKIVDEMADALIMYEQLLRIFKFTDKVKERMLFKLYRLDNKLEKKRKQEKTPIYGSLS